MADCGKEDSSSSSDDELLISSPDPTDNEGDEDGGPSLVVQQSPPKKLRRASHRDDVFKFHAQKFSKVTPTLDGAANSKPPLSSYSHPRCPSLQPSRRGRRPKVKLGIEEKLSILEQRHRASRNREEKGCLMDSDDDDDDDSGSEEMKSKAPNPKGTATSRSPKRKLSFAASQPHVAGVMPSTSSAGRATRTSRASVRLSSKPEVDPSLLPKVCELSSSDDDDDNTRQCGKGVARSNLAALPADVAEIVQRSRQAKTKLAEAQRYHADDIVVEIEEPIIPSSSSLLASGPRRSSPLLSVAVASSGPPVSLGHKLKFLCRVHILPAGGTKRPPQELKIAIRYLEKLSVLMGKIVKALELPHAAKMTMDFDGNVLDREKTPKDYEMEDEDMIDVSIVTRS
jgi:hypothetical protein